MLYSKKGRQHSRPINYTKGENHYELTIVSTIIDFLVVYLVCNTTAGYLSGRSPELVSRAGLIWRIYLICMIIILACSVLTLIPFINLLAGLIIIITGLVQIVASILYIIFLYQSQKALS